MRKGIKSSGICLLAVLLLPSMGAPWAQVPFTNTELSKRVALGITEGPDPIPQVAWNFGQDQDSNGDAFRDGLPVIAYDSDTGWPHVVWAYDNGDDHDVAYAAWTGDDWESVFLTTSPADDVDPTVHLSAAGISVLWRDSELDLLWLTTKAPGGAWSEPESVNLAGASSPRSLTTWQSRVLTAFERPAIGGGQEVVLLTRFGPGLHTVQIMAATGAIGAMNPVLHAEDGAIWLDWRQSAGNYGFVVLVEGEWTGLESVTWDATNLLEVRQLIRSRVLAGQ